MSWGERALAIADYCVRCICRSLVARHIWFAKMPGSPAPDIEDEARGNALVVKMSKDMSPQSGLMNDASSTALAGRTCFGFH